MESQEHVLSATEWLALPEVSLPVVEDATRHGSVYFVHKVGFALASLEQCDEAGLSVHLSPEGRCILPTAGLDFDGKRELCRLPLDLGPWAFDAVAMAHSGGNVFPASVEFGILGGRCYAELL